MYAVRAENAEVWDSRGETIRLLMPLTITDPTLREGLDKLEAALRR